jgi:peptidoglycan-N-acetylglucosamine deacetylase
MRADYRSPAPVALTFDDGPDPIWPPLVLDALASVEARATFFVVAPRAARYASLIFSMRERGHDVAFHCVEHVRHDAEGDRSRRRVRTPGARAVRALLENAVGLYHTGDRRGGKQTSAPARRLDR